jgi:hypothetical protein
MDIVDDYDLKQVANKVYASLIERPIARDDDRALLYMVWSKECEHLPLGTKFLDAFLEGKVSNPESVTRMRRKLQEKHESLRGDKWEARHNMEAVVCQQLSLFD